MDRNKSYKEIKLSIFLKENKKPDKISNTAIIDNIINGLLTQASLEPDGMTVETLHDISGWQEIRDKEINSERQKESQQPKKFWGVVFILLAIICVCVIGYNIFSYEEALRAFNIYFNSFITILFILFTMAANISFHPRHLYRFIDMCRALMQK